MKLLDQSEFGKIPNDEVDLYGQKGGYIRLMDSKTKDTPCPNCGTDIQKISYLGGACYLCVECQQ
ncbi:MAG: hypothetical protein ISR58_02395 [Anaerolineales bacterium]|nr:hypothetical protein [Anaerolineales bacterium]